MPARPLTLGLLFAAVTSLPSTAALAGTVYVPVTGAGPGAPATPGVTYDTRLYVANTGTVPRQVTLSGVTGAPQSFTILGGGTLVLTGLVPGGGRGLLAVDGAPQISVAARLVAADPLGTPLSIVQAPAISGRQTWAAGATAQIQGTERTAATATTLGLVNLAARATSCTLRAFRIDATQVGGDAIVSVPAQSLREFDDAWHILGQERIADARFTVSCGDPFSAYAKILSADGRRTLFLTPDGSLADSTATDPSPNPPPPASDTVTVTRPGLFFSPVEGASALDVPLPVVPGRRYGSATIEFDLTTGLFAPVFNSIAALVQPGDTRTDRTLYFGFHIRGRRSRTFIDLGVPVLEPALRGDFAWQENATYHLKIFYDTKGKSLLLQVSQNGQVVHSVSGGVFNLDLENAGSGLVLKLGLPGIADNAYFPPIGWQFANLSVTVAPAS
jgi:hypothetical protein